MLLGCLCSKLTHEKVNKVQVKNICASEWVALPLFLDSDDILRPLMCDKDKTKITRWASWFATDAVIETDPRFGSLIWHRTSKKNICRIIYYCTITDQDRQFLFLANRNKNTVGKEGIVLTCSILTTKKQNKKTCFLLRNMPDEQPERGQPSSFLPGVSNSETHSIWERREHWERVFHVAQDDSVGWPLTTK